MTETGQESIKFLGKVLIKGKMEVCTGLHIGTSQENMKIGGVDSPVVRDPVTNLPYIPGSSLKGKLRSLSEKYYNKKLTNISNNPPINLHVCDNKNCEICRIFGSTHRNNKFNIPSRLIARDMHLQNRDELENISDLPYTEWKFENSIDRVTSTANPRQLERVPSGAIFDLELVYDVQGVNQLKKDLKNIQNSLNLLELDSLGGHGSRGYGKVKFENVSYNVYPRSYYVNDETLLQGLENIDEVVNAFGDNNE